MPVKLKCPTCGKTRRLPEPVVEQTLSCLSCGLRIHVPGKPTSSDEAGAEEMEAFPAAGQLPDGRPGFPRRGSWLIGGAGLAVLLLAAMLILALLALWVSDMRRSARETFVATTARRLESHAEMLAQAGRLEEARDQYRALSDFLVQHARSSAALQPILSRASMRETGLNQQIANRISSQSLKVSDTRASSAASRRPRSTPPTSNPSTRDRLPTAAATELARPPSPTSMPAPPPPSRPLIQPVAEERNELTDQRIGDAIAAGVDWMIRQFDPKRHELLLQIGDREPLHAGMDALAVYALMQSSQAAQDPRLNLHGEFMKGCLEVVKQFPNEKSHATYARGIRATALALNNRPEDRAALRADVRWLIDAARDGAYTYTKLSGSGPRRSIDASWDNSNSQYGLLGVWSGAEADVEVPSLYWKAVENHWTSCQAKSGQWAYGGGKPEGGTMSMTAAGVASLFVTHDWLDAPRFGANVGRDPFSPALQKGLHWFEEGDNSVNINGGWWGYTLYGVERVGLASGFKYFGSHDWYRELAGQIVKAQGSEGSWGNGSPVDTAYCLLFLSRGRHPILMNKLRFDGYWANRPRDLANLARYTSRQLERTVNWQVVPIVHPWTDWNDSPIVYLASHQPPHLSLAEIDNLRQFVQAGGLLFTQADGDSTEFNQFAVELAHQLFPQYELTDLPANHPIYSVVYKINPRVPLKMVSNGARVLMLHSPADLARPWQLREQKVHPASFELGVNLFIYAAGKRDLRNRLESNYIAEVKSLPTQTIRVARVQYGGDWNPEPYAWTRFQRQFQRETSYRVGAIPTPMTGLDAVRTPIAHLTGAGRYYPTPDETAAVRRYVESGGVLVIDMTGGTGSFDESTRANLLTSAFPDARPKVIGPGHPVLSAGPSGMQDLGHPRLRPYMVERFGNGGGYLSGFAQGKGHVLFTNLDLTCGLLNTNTWGIIGYEPTYAQALLRNILFWTMDGQKDE